MSNTPSLSETLCSAIRNKGYTTKDQTDEIVETDLKIVDTYVPVYCSDCGKAWIDTTAHANLCVAEMLRQDYSPQVRNGGGE